MNITDNGNEEQTHTHIKHKLFASETERKAKRSKANILQKSGIISIIIFNVYSFI